MVTVNEDNKETYECPLAEIIECGNLDNIMELTLNGRDILSDIDEIC